VRSSVADEGIDLTLSTLYTESRRTVVPVDLCTSVTQVFLRTVVPVFIVTARGPEDRSYLHKYGENTKCAVSRTAQQ